MINPDMESIPWARVALACVTVAVLLALMGFVLKYIKMRGFIMPGVAAGERRLQVIESLPLDPRRRLVIVRCDNAEHLLLLGAGEDVVVAANLAQAPAGLQTKSKSRA